MSVEEILPIVTSNDNNTIRVETEPLGDPIPTNVEFVFTDEQILTSILEITETVEFKTNSSSIEPDVSTSSHIVREHNKSPLSLFIGGNCEVAGLKAEGLGSSWCPATIIEKIKNGSEYIIEYRTLLDENDNSKRLSEAVNSRRIRTEPVSCEVDITLKPGFPVDIFLNDVWWNVVVKSSVDGKLEVFFPSYELEPCYSLPNSILSPLKFEPKDGDIRPGLELKTDPKDRVKKWFWRDTKVIYNTSDAEPILAKQQQQQPPPPQRRSKRRDSVKAAISHGKRTTKRKKPRRG